MMAKVRRRRTSGASSVMGRGVSPTNAMPLAVASCRQARIMRCTSWYTRPSVALNPVPPLTLADWSRAYDDGVSPLQALLALQRRLEVESPPGVWIAIAGRAFVEAQVEALQTRAAG